MDYMTKPLSRTAIRKLSKCIREIFGLSADEPFPVLEWQSKALCGELTIPYEATIGMKPKEIMKIYPVTEASARYRVKQDKKK